MAPVLRSHQAGETIEDDLTQPKDESVDEWRRPRGHHKRPNGQASRHDDDKDTTHYGQRIENLAPHQSARDVLRDPQSPPGVRTSITTFARETNTDKAPFRPQSNRNGVHTEVSQREVSRADDVRPALIFLSCPSNLARATFRSGVNPVGIVNA